MAIKRLRSKGDKIFIWVMLTFIFFVNVIIFGFCIFNSFEPFIKSSIITGFIIALFNPAFDFVVRKMFRRFPSAGDMFRRIVYILPFFYLFNYLSFAIIFYIYNHLNLLECSVKPNSFFWTFLFGCCISTMIAFFNLGVANWEAWKSSINETGKLKNSYQRSRILGLKGQLNPHFLFNCFNILSGLIQENEGKAEEFLDEMTKVHRYLLRSDDDFLVPLESELKFAKSYLYLTNCRFGDAIKTNINIDKKLLEKHLPPLSMHVILDNIIYTNALEKNNPLNILIETNDSGSIKISNSVHQKTIVKNLNVDDGLDNLINKYKMLKGKEILIEENDKIRNLILPLFDRKEEQL